MAGAWGDIASLVPAAELPALEIAVGCSLIEKCTDLRNEADALRDIVEDYAQQNGGTPGSTNRRRSAPRPIDRRRPRAQMLERKVSMLLDYLGGAGSEPERASRPTCAGPPRNERGKSRRRRKNRTRADAAAGAKAADGRARRLFIDRGDSSDVVAGAAPARAGSRGFGRGDRAPPAFDEERAVVEGTGGRPRKSMRTSRRCRI